MRPAPWLWIPFALQAALAALLCFVPLFDLLGYEFCLACGALAAITAPMLGLILGGRARTAGGALRAALGAALLHLVPPLALIALNAARVRNCNFFVGLGFFALLPAATALYGSALGVLCARILVGARPAMRRTVLALGIATPLLLCLLGLYTQPPIFVFDHLWGYFAGSLYDENIGLDARLWAFRGGTLVRTLAVAAAVMAWEGWARIGTLRLLLTLACGVLASSGYDRVIGRRAGYLVTAADVDAALPVRVLRPGIVVHLPAGTSEAQQRAVADDHAFRLQALHTALALPQAPTIDSYVYPDAATKARLMGGRGTMFTKPWRHEIHVHDVVAPHPVMPHELAHAVAAQFGSPLLGVSAHYVVGVHMGLVEGLAEALTPDQDELTLHAWARALRALDLAPDMRALLGAADFYAQSPRRAYTVAGSFVRYLLATYGAGPLKAAYPAGDFLASYGQPLPALVAAWEAWLAQLPLAARETRIATERFRPASIFARACAHEIAALSAAAAVAPAAEAVALRREICAHLGDAPAAQLELALALRRAGDVEGFFHLSHALTAAHALNSVQQATLAQARSEVLWEQGRQGEAMAQAQEVLDSGVGRASERLAWVRLWAMRLPPERAGAVMPYLDGKLAPLPAALMLERGAREDAHEPTYGYLLGRLLHHHGHFAPAAHFLAAAGPHPYRAIEAERLRLLGDAAWREDDLTAATRAFGAAEQLAETSGEAAQARDMLARLAWQRMRAAE